MTQDEKIRMLAEKAHGWKVRWHREGTRGTYQNRRWYYKNDTPIMPVRHFNPFESIEQAVGLLDKIDLPYTIRKILTSITPERYKKQLKTYEIVIHYTKGLIIRSDNDKRIAISEAAVRVVLEETEHEQA